MRLLSKIRHFDYRLFRVIERLRSISKPKIVASNILVNAGMPRSGSTVVHIAIRKLLGINGEIRYIDNAAGFKSLNNRDYFKTHSYFREVDRACRLEELKLIITVRDIRDIAVSLIQKGWAKDLNDLIDRYVLDYIVNTAMCYSDLKSALILRYEDFNLNQMGMLRDIAGYLDITIDESNLLNLVHEMNPDEIRAKIPTVGYNENLGLHSNHIADGLSGKYAEFFTEEEIKILQSRFKRFYKRFDYVC